MREFVVEGIIPLVGMVLSFAAAIAIIMIITRSRQRRLEIQAELQSKLIEKFGSTPDLINFLQSPAGRQFVTGVQTSNTMLMRDRIVLGIRRAIFMSFLGVAFLALWMITNTRGLAWPGILFLVLGLGYFVATVATAKMTKETETPPPQA